MKIEIRTEQLGGSLVKGYLQALGKLCGHSVLASGNAITLDPQLEADKRAAAVRWWCVNFTIEWYPKESSK